MSDTINFEQGTFCWVDLSTRDMEAAKRWYSQLFGWEVSEGEPGGPPYAMFTMGGKMVAGVGQMSDDMIRQGIPPTWNSYVSVNDARAIEAKVRELGGTITVPAMEVMNAGWMAFFQDPTGGHLGVWQPNEHRGAQLINQPNSLCWNELMTRDVDKAKSFFAALFGWTYDEMPTDTGPYSIARVGEQRAGGMMAMEGPMWEGIPPHWMAYFAVADTDAIANRVRETGGKVCVEPTDIPVGRFAVLEDPQGTYFSVIKLNPMG